MKKPTQISHFFWVGRSTQAGYLRQATGIRSIAGPLARELKSALLIFCGCWLTYCSSPRHSEGGEAPGPLILFNTLVHAH